MSRPILFLVGLLIAAARSVAALTQATSPADAAFLDSLLAVEMPKHGVPGAVVAIVRGGRVLTISIADAETALPDQDLAG